MSVASSLAAGFTGFLVYKSEPGSTLFSYHPILMTLAIFNRSNPIRNWIPVRVITFHWLLSTLALLCVTGGMYAAYEHKEMKSKPHFVTLHAKLGLAANVGLFLIAIVGVGVFFGISWAKSKLVKQFHIAGGAIVYVTAVAALLTGLSSNWFSVVVMKSAPSYWKTLYFLPILCGFVVTVQVTLTLIRKLTKKNKPKNKKSE